MKSATNGEAANIPMVRWSREQGFQTDTDAVAGEEPLEIRVQGESVSVTMRTPGHDRELAAGFLLGEGLIRSADQILHIGPCQNAPPGSEGNLINIRLMPGVEIDLGGARRNTFMTSSCGLCGKSSIEKVHMQFPPLEAGADREAPLSPDLILSLPERLAEVQPCFKLTGGLHAAALFDFEGRVLAAFEDVGRHNAVDKLLGWALLERLLPLEAHIMMVSGRASFEIAQKALAARIPILAAVSAPSSLAVQFAGANRQTLVGFLRNGRFNIYTHPDRIAGPTGASFDSLP